MSYSYFKLIIGYRLPHKSVGVKYMYNLELQLFWVFYTIKKCHFGIK